MMHYERTLYFLPRANKPRLYGTMLFFPAPQK
jgi:hypothetical protein